MYTVSRRLEIAYHPSITRLGPWGEAHHAQSNNDHTREGVQTLFSHHRGRDTGRPRRTELRFHVLHVHSRSRQEEGERIELPTQRERHRVCCGTQDPAGRLAQRHSLQAAGLNIVDDEDHCISCSAILEEDDPWPLCYMCKHGTHPPTSL